MRLSKCAKCACRTGPNYDGLMKGEAAKYTTSPWPKSSRTRKESVQGETKGPHRTNPCSHDDRGWIALFHPALPFHPLVCLFLDSQHTSNSVYSTTGVESLPPPAASLAFETPPFSSVEGWRTGGNSRTWHTTEA